MTTRPSSEVWRGRIGTYLLGVGLGFVLVGLILGGKVRIAKRESERAAAAAVEAARPAPTPLPASKP